jgi:recombination protein RecA
MEETSEVGKANMALLARFLPPELRRITPMLAASKVTLIAINQIRDTMAMYGDPTSSPGGRALAHANNVMVNFAKINGADSKIERNGEQVGHHVKARIEKNKKAAPFKVAEFAIEYVKGVVDTGEELRVLGAKYGVIQRPNNVTYTYQGQTYRGKEAMAAALTDPEVQASIWAEIREARMNGKEAATEVAEEGATE